MTRPDIQALYPEARCRTNVKGLLEDWFYLLSGDRSMGHLQSQSWIVEEEGLGSLTADYTREIVIPGWWFGSSAGLMVGSWVLPGSDQTGVLFSGCQHLGLAVHL